MKNLKFAVIAAFALCCAHAMPTTQEIAATKGVALKFYQDDTCFGEMKTKFAWKKPRMLILGGLVSPTYDEVRIYSRALSLPKIITAVNLGSEKMVEGK